MALPYRHTQRSSVLPVILAVTAGFVVLGDFYRPRARTTDNNCGDARSGKGGLTAVHIRFDHRHEHLVMVLQFDDCRRDGRRTALALRRRARLHDCARRDRQSTDRPAPLVGGLWDQVFWPETLDLRHWRLRHRRSEPEAGRVAAVGHRRSARSRCSAVILMLGEIGRRAAGPRTLSAPA